MTPDGLNGAHAVTESRILVIRGGAIGDFVLTLPAIGLLRDGFPNARIELLGYPHIASLAEGRYYVDRVRSIEYGPMSGFFAKNAELNAELSEYFAGFQQVVSFLFDPDGIFEANVRRCGVRNFMPAFRRPSGVHAAREWAAPLESLALYLQDPAAKLFPTEDDRSAALAWFEENAGAVGSGRKRGMRFAIHPGSGSSKKNWSVQKWGVLGLGLIDAFPEAELILVGGEADGDALLASPFPDVLGPHDGQALALEVAHPSRRLCLLPHACGLYSVRVWAVDEQLGAGRGGPPLLSPRRVRELRVHPDLSWRHSQQRDRHVPGGGGGGGRRGGG
jgi:hypothetical protein